MNLAPIILFTYNRLSHTKKTITALQKNELAKDSELFIYSDGGKDENSWNKVNEIRKYLETISGFKNITIIKRETNIGLAENIIEGVTKIVNQYGKIIVLEDDIVTNSYFLNFMNDSLNTYENISKVWHISGWNYPISNENLEDTFLYRTMNCWGWATWKDRWSNYEKNPQKLIESFSKEEIYKFNLDGAINFWEQVEKNLNNQMNTWAIFWYTTIFKNEGLCLNPTQSFVENIGFDGTGTNTGYRNNYSSNLSRINYNIRFENKLKENQIATDRIKLFYRQNNEENKNISFSKNLNKIFALLSTLKISSDKYILYGSGTGMDLVSNFLINNIEFIVDNDIEKHDSYKNGFKIIGLPFFKDFDTNSKIIITVFGRASEIIETLSKEHQIPKDRLISLDIF
ncbi:glycosyltransferase [Arcobacter cloacae]|uniref:Sugar transferase n=1 Tax=Arcobacter cloacae TaxID=1054034 RepID=A0A4Q0ZEG4_9BACT|nr:glycosyltransferase [Arcobacter cloacae]RXJ84392.1 sugar transferase [Arcobacter cloacae]